MTGRSDGSWDQTPEQPGSRWIRILLWISKTMGRRAFEVSLSPVVACYAAFAKGARKESLRYLARVKNAREKAGLPRFPEPLTPYRISATSRYRFTTGLRPGIRTERVVSGFL